MSGQEPDEGQIEALAAFEFDWDPYTGKGDWPKDLEVSILSCCTVYYGDSAVGTGRWLDGEFSRMYHMIQWHWWDIIQSPYLYSKTVLTIKAKCQK